MFKQVWLNFATVFVSLKECVVKENRLPSSEEVIADLHTYLEFLNKKTSEIEIKIRKCEQKALYHKKQADQEASKSGKTREQNRAKLFLKDKRRLQDEQDKAMKFTHVIRQQIDSLTTSELDNIMIDAMRQYNMTATKMGLPDRTKEIEELGNDLQERFSEASQLQQILGDATDPSALSTSLAFGSLEVDEADLELEFESLGESAPKIKINKIKKEEEEEEEEEEEKEEEVKRDHAQRKEALPVI